MKVYVRVEIQNEPGDTSQGNPYGSLSFAEQANFDNAGFALVSKIFTRCHELLEVLKAEHAISTDGLKRR